MNSSKINWKGLSVLIVIGFAIFINLTDNSGDVFIEKFKNRRIQGVVMERYIDKLNHMNKTVVITDEKGKLDTLIMNGDESDFFEELKIGDTIIKKENDFLIIVNPNSDNKEFLISFYY